MPGTDRQTYLTISSNLGFSVQDPLQLVRRGTLQVGSSLESKPWPAPIFCLEPNFSDSMAAMTQLLVLLMAAAAALCMSISVQGWSLEETPYDGPNTISDKESSPHFSQAQGLKITPTDQPKEKHVGSSLGAPGIRVEMVARNSSCAGIPLVGPESRILRIQCALERSARRLNHLLAGGRYSSTDFLRSVADDTTHNDDEAVSSGESSKFGSSLPSYQFPESAGNGEFIVPIELGTPPQKASIIIDTGSDLTWLQCQPCTSCFAQTDPVFDPSKSSTYKRLSCSTAMCRDLLGQTCSSSTCSYGYSYGDGSMTQGYFSTETTTVALTTGGKSAINGFAFGCGYYNTGTFGQTGGEGILGLGQGPVSYNSQLGSLYGNKFSYCMVDWLSSGTTTASPMYFGDAAVPAAMASSIKYTPIIANANYPTYYYIGITGISVGTTKLSIDPKVFQISSSGTGGTIIDSGTTITYLQSTAYNAVVTAYKAQVTYPTTTSSSGLSTCFNTSKATSPTFPTLTIHLDGVNLALPLANTFVLMEANTMCLAVESTSQFLAIFGNIQQQNYHIVYDAQNKEIGFAPLDCKSA